MRTLIATVVAVLLLAGCGSTEDGAEEKAGAKDKETSAASPTSSPSTSPSAAASGSAAKFPPPSPMNPRLGQPFTASIEIGKQLTRVRITLTAIDTYTGQPFPELKGGTPKLYRYRVTNLGKTVTTEQDPVSYHFAGLDENEHRTTPSGYAFGTSASPDGCVTLPDKIRWKTGQTLSACSVQTLPKGSKKLSSAAFLSGDIKRPWVAEFQLP